MRVAFRADGAAFMGGGHVMRCLALANALAERGATCIFLCRHLTDALGAQISRFGHRLIMLPARPKRQDTGPLETVHADWLAVRWEDDAADTEAALTEPQDWLIVDHYALDARWHRALRKATKRILVIDDLADRPLDCDALLDPNFRPEGDDPFVALLRAGCRRFSGPQMALLDPVFADAHSRARVRKAVERVFLYLGNARAEYFIPALDALVSADLFVDLVSGDAVVNDPRIRNHPSVRAGQTSLYGPQPSLVSFMERADLAIGPIGTSTWERCCLGLPTLGVTIALNQQRIAQNLSDAGLIILLGSVDSLNEKKFRNAMLEIQKGKMISEISKKNLLVCDGKGVMRMVEFIFSLKDDLLYDINHSKDVLALEMATLDDAEIIHFWRNHPTTRAVSISQDYIVWAQHLEWFSRSLANAQRIILVGRIRETNTKVGMVRIDISDDRQEGEVSIMVDPAQRGQGYGLSLLRAGLDWFQRAGVTIFNARILITNSASQACFRKAGFRLVGCDSKILLFQCQFEEQKGDSRA